MRGIASYSEVQSMSFNQLFELHEAMGYMDDAEHYAYEKAREKK